MHVYRHGDQLPEELTNVTTTVLVASITGFLFGGMIGARHAADKYILMNHGSKFTSTMQAQVSTVLWSAQCIWMQTRLAGCMSIIVLRASPDHFLSTAVLVLGVRIHEHVVCFIGLKRKSSIDSRLISFTHDAIETTV